MHVVLFQPEIPSNTGNVARLCAATNATLHLIEPLGFRLDDTRMKRAGMDYWDHVDWKVWDKWPSFLKTMSTDARIWLIESGGGARYDEVEYRANDVLVFGRETAGLPKRLLEERAENWLRIPMFNTDARSLNLSNCVALVLYEAHRQQGFQGEVHD